ncbi:MAG: hypothetical protein WCS86_04125 [Candidatus Paceibacterota bacterium]
MGSIIEINDTLQISKKQGFPEELVLEEHLENSLKAENFSGKIFEFKNKDGIRIFHAPPVRNFLVENINGRWIYWGLCHILETTCDYENNITSGKFKIIYINTPEEMRKAHELIDRNFETNYFT